MTHTFVNIGRHRGEFERATKKLMQAHAGTKHPQDLGFASQVQLADRMLGAMVKCNGLVKEGRLQKGVPDDRWGRSLTAKPLTALDPAHLWIFLPEHRELEIRGGHVRPGVDGEIISFCHPELMAMLGNGYRLIVRFDPTEPTLGAALLNNEDPCSTRNIHGWKVGEVLGIADFVETAPQFRAHASFSPSADLRKRYHRANAAAYRATGLYGQRAGAADEARLGDGRVARVERGGQSTATRPPQPGREPAPGEPLPQVTTPARRRKSPFASTSQDEYARDRKRRQRSLAAQEAAEAAGEATTTLRDVLEPVAA